MKCQKCKKEVLDHAAKLCISCTLAKQEAEAWARREAAVHAIQSGVLLEISLGGGGIEPKHLRTGVNAAMCDISALVELLAKKGVFELHEYAEASAAKMEDEKARYEKLLSIKLGKQVKLV